MKTPIVYPAETWAVELIRSQNPCWLTTGEGDPARTHTPECATRFLRYEDAQTALVDASDYGRAMEVVPHPAPFVDPLAAVIARLEGVPVSDLAAIYAHEKYIHDDEASGVEAVRARLIQEVKG